MRTSTAPRRAVGGLAVAAVLLAACGQDSPAADTAATEHATAAPLAAAPSPTAGPAPGETSTTAATDDASPTADERSSAGSGLDGAGLDGTGLAGAGLHGVAEAGDRLVAVGTATDGPGAWTSDDGVEWTPWPVGVPTASRVRAVASVDGTVVAFVGDDLVASRGLTATRDGWAATDASGIDGRVNALAVGDGAWFAVGERIDAEGGEATAGVVWRSDDARSWQVATEGLAVAGGTVSDVAVAGGTVVVVGFDLTDGLVWIGGSDGVLEPVGVSAFGRATIQGVAAVDDGFVALGRGVGDLRPYLWRSSDGRSWRRSELDPTVFPPDDAIHDLAAAADGLVAVGASPDGGVVWTSPDGADWTRVAP